MQFVYKSILMLKVTIYVSMTLQTIYTEVCSPWSFDQPFAHGKNLQASLLNEDEQII